MVKVTREQAALLGLKRYFTGEPCVKGHIAERFTRDNNCRECARLRSKAYRDADMGAARRKCVEAERLLKETNPELWAEKRKIRRQQVRDKHGPVAYLIGQIKGRAKRKGQEFSITRDDIVVPKECPILGIPLVFTETHATDSSPSLDRIDNTKGYIPGNVHVISLKANRIKSDATVEELERIATYLRSLEITSLTQSDLTVTPTLR